TLSFERVAKETLKFLAAQNPMPAWRLMGESGVLQYFAPEAVNYAGLDVLLRAEEAHKIRAAALTRFAALLPQDENLAAAFAMRMKFSNRDTATLALLAQLPVFLRADLSPLALRRVLYVYGAENCREAVLLNGADVPVALAVIAAWENPVFPLK